MYWSTGYCITVAWIGFTLQLGFKFQNLAGVKSQEPLNSQSLFYVYYSHFNKLGMASLIICLQEWILWYCKLRGQSAPVSRSCLSGVCWDLYMRLKFTGYWYIYTSYLVTDTCYTQCTWLRILDAWNDVMPVLSAQRPASEWKKLRYVRSSYTRNRTSPLSVAPTSDNLLCPSFVERVECGVICDEREWCCEYCKDCQGSNDTSILWWWTIVSGCNDHQAFYLYYIAHEFQECICNDDGSSLLRQSSLSYDRSSPSLLLE